MLKALSFFGIIFGGDIMRKNLLLIFSVILIAIITISALHTDKRSTPTHRSDGIMSISLVLQKGSISQVDADKNTKAPVKITVTAPDGTMLYDGSGKMHSRGSSSFHLPKKSYTLSFGDGFSLLPNGSAEKYVLIANSFDRSMLRNKIIYDFAKELSPEWSPYCDYAELFVNGEYKGLYLISEKIEPEKLNITDSGFLCMLERRREVLTEPYYESYFKSNYFYIKYAGKNVTADTVLQKITAAERAFASKDGIDPVTNKHFTELIDVESWARKYLIDEIFQNADKAVSSQYFYCRDENDKVRFGPVWDMDRTIGNAVNNDPERFTALEFPDHLGEHNLWYDDLYVQKEFYDTVMRLYKDEYLPLMEKYLDGRIAEYESTIASAKIRDYELWAKTYELAAETMEKHDYAMDAASITEFLRKRIAFLNEQWLKGA